MDKREKPQYIRYTGFTVVILCAIIQGHSHRLPAHTPKELCANWWRQRTTCKKQIINPQDHQKGSTIHQTPYLNVTVLRVRVTHSSSCTPGLSSWHLPSQMFRWIRPMTPPEGSAVISSIPDLRLDFKGQKLVWVFQGDKNIIPLNFTRRLKILCGSAATNHCNITD